MKKTFLTFLCYFLANLVVQAQTQKLDTRNLTQLAQWMSGEFNSKKQSRSDPDFWDISLRMKQIWSERTDGYWLYVEQAQTEKSDKPYRQRVYHLYLLDDTTIVSKVYEIEQPEMVAGAWHDPGKLKNLSYDRLIDRQGCSIMLKKTGKKSLSGSTPAKECLSSLRGATYATSEVTVYRNKLISWDRGWNADDRQVWGSEKGGYIFNKVKSWPVIITQ